MHQQFMVLYESLYDDIYRYVFAKTDSKWDADDLVSEVFTKAFEGYSPGIRNPTAWLFRIARNTVADFYRKHRELPRGDSIGETGESGDSVQANIEMFEQVTALRECLPRLCPEDFDLVCLHYLAGLKLRDVAEVLHKSEGSVKMKVMRARNRLGALVKQKMEE